VTEYALPAPVASLPLATCWAEVDRLTAAPQAPALPPTTPVQVALTADVGTVPQLANVAADACTFKVQVLPTAPPDVDQLTVADELPANGPASGSVAVKLMVAGVAVIALNVVAIGKTISAGTTMRAFCAESICMVPAASTTDISLDQRLMRR
jgi:hypothetical protein